MWPFGRKKREPGIRANSVTFDGSEAVIDVRGQTCPGYLLAINRAVDELAAGTRARLLMTYAPCGDDVLAWCRRRELDYLGLSVEDGVWVIRIRK